MQATLSAGLSRVETDQFTPLQLSLQPFDLIENLWCKLDFKERETTNEIKCELGKLFKVFWVSTEKKDNE